MIIDSHCHIDFDEFNTDRDDIMARAHLAGIKHIIVPAVASASWPKVKSVCEQYIGLHPAYGLHPYFLDQHTEKDLELLYSWIEQEQPIAIGECGLDYYLKDLDRDKQLYFFDAQLAIASKFDLPVIIHSRKATEQVIRQVKKYKNIRGMIHSYSGSMEQAKQLIELGFYLSFGGAITYDKATKLRSIARQLPDHTLLIETDAPDQPPSRYHGTRNQPDYISEVIASLAELRDCSPQQLMAITSQNTQTLFRLDSL